ncbi:hypothetical protein [Streptomyces noursei]|uniref:hypothetical protein n=1 Tax=Streptomyces noursei TaxID=1971 RepID=UPI0037F6D4FA
MSEHGSPGHECPLTLSYSLDFPNSPVQAGPSGTASPAVTVGTSTNLTVTVTNTGTSDVDCEQIILTLPFKDKTALCDPSSVVRPVTIDVKLRYGAWDLTRTKNRFEYDLAPEDGVDPVIEKQEHLSVELRNIKVSNSEGQSYVAITETRSKEPPHSCRIPVEKLPAGCTVGGFAPNLMSIKAGSPAELTWTSTPAPGQDITFTVSYVAASGEITEPVGKTHNFRTQDLFHDSPLTLQAAISPTDLTTVPHTVTLNSFVVIARPDLTVGNITTTGAVHLHSAPQITTLQLPERDTPTVLRSGTDGVLALFVDAPVTQLPKIKLGLKPSKGNTVYDVTLIPQRRHVSDGVMHKPCFTVPIPKDHEIHLAVIGSSPYPAEAGLRLHWNPLGIERLTNDHPAT